MKKSNKYSLEMCVAILFAICSICALVIVCVLFMSVTEQDNSYVSHLFVVGIFICVFLIWNIWFAESIVDAINLLLIAQFVFLGSNSILKTFKIDTKDYFVGFSLTNKDYILTNSIIILGIMFFIFGAIVARIKNKYHDCKKEKTYELNKYCNKAGLLLLFIGIITFIIDFDFSWLDTSYKEFGSKTVWELLWSMCIPLSGFFLISSEMKKYKKTGLLILFALSVLYILVGNRGYSISLLLTSLWLYDNSLNKIPVRKVIVISIILIYTSNMFYQMKPLTVRQKLDLNQYFNMDKESLFLPTLVEGSATYRTLIYTVKYIPKSKKFEYGASYFWAITTIIPNIFRTGIHPAHLYYQGPSEWLRWSFAPLQAKMGQGFGFSMVGEAYYNFGILGVVFIMFIFGYFISKYSSISNINKSVFNKVTLAIFLSNFIWGVRNPASSIVRNIVWQRLMAMGTLKILDILEKFRV